MGHETSIFEEVDVSEAQEFLVCFCSCRGTVENLHDLQAKKDAPIVSCTIDLLDFVT